MSAYETSERLRVALADRYTIARELGAGGMATVYLARDLKHDRLVALKVLKPELAAVIGGERFLSEIKTTANLQHPHILALFDSGAVNGTVFYAMPFIDGESLRDKLDREKQLPIDDALRIAREVADALQYAHERGVIHRDIKPENILLQGGHALVADFGIALAASTTGGARMTETGMSLGTPTYMSPEQAMGERTLDARTDIYALGCVLYEMLVGDPPFTGSTAQAIVARVLIGTPESLTAQRGTIPPHVEATVMTALQKLPADRFASAKAFSEALANSSFTTAGTAHHLTRGPQPATSRRTVSALAAVALLSVAAAVIGTTGWMRTRRTPEPVAARFAIELPEGIVFGSSASSRRRMGITPDGSQVAFVTSTPFGSTAANAVYVRRASEPVAERVGGTDSATSVSYSPDGKWLLFTTVRGLKRVLSAGGVPQTIASVQDPRQIYAASWGEDGRIVYALASYGLWVVSADGGEPRRLTADTPPGDSAIMLTEPDILPGGTHALVSVVKGFNSSTRSNSLGLLALADGRVTDLGVVGEGPKFVSPGQVVFHRGSTVFAAPFSARSQSVSGPVIQLVTDVSDNVGPSDFAAARNGAWLAYQTGSVDVPTTMWAVDRRGRERQLTTPETKSYANGRISPDGRRVVLRVMGGAFNRGDLWIYEIEGGAISKLTTDGASFRPAWSRDGSTLFYVNGRGDSSRIASRPWDGSGVETIHLRRPLLAEVEPGLAHTFFAIRTLIPRDIYLAPADSLSKLRPFLTSAAEERNPAISPNGRWLAYLSDESGKLEAYIRPLPGPGARVPVSIGGATHARWAPDGKALFYRSPKHLMMASLVETPQLAVTRRDTLFVDPYSRASGETNFDVFPNGNEFLFFKSVESRNKMYMIVNWQSMLTTAAAAAREP
ncbi:protein kinase domain-containing protein [Gemmatimonas sp.]|uniref:protein kinase domain-containing protein n=1 Tax=Gemmatimonas sp. TaxID=1962908 RepID=UPI0039832F5A